MSLKSKLDAGEFVVLAEMEPPKGVDVSQMVEKATKVKGAVDAFVIPEMSSAVMRMSSLGGAMVLQNQGMETVMQANCRDRNRLALQADLLAAQACGIQNVMAVTGEDPSFGDHHQAGAVYDISLEEMLRMIQSLQAGKDMAGIELLGSTDFTVGSTVEAFLTGTELDKEIEEMQKKIDAGTRFFITPPVFDLQNLEPFINKTAGMKAQIIPTVLLLKSLGMVRYMARNVKNVIIEDTLVNRIRDAADKVRECITITANLVKDLEKKGLSGAHIVTIGWEDRLPEIMGGMGL